MVEQLIAWTFDVYHLELSGGAYVFNILCGSELTFGSCLLEIRWSFIFGASSRQIYHFHFSHAAPCAVCVPSWRLELPSHFVIFKRRLRP